MSATYNVGDTVVLKSGGPEMTVQFEPAEDRKYYQCQWFAGKRLESGRFPGDSITDVNKETK